jgi:hypothetical protein
MPDRTDSSDPTVAAGSEPRRSEERGWIDRFETQLSVQQVRAENIRRAVADVRTHCADSGQSYQEAFGDPASYATILAAELPPAPQRPSISLRRIAMLLPQTMGFAIGAVWLTTGNVSQAPISVGQLLTVVVAVPAWVVFTSPVARSRPRDPLTPSRPALDEKGWRPIWVTLGLVVVAALLWFGLDQVIFSVPKWLLFALWVVLFASGVLLTWLLRPRALDSKCPSTTDT